MQDVHQFHLHLVDGLFLPPLPAVVLVDSTKRRRDPPLTPVGIMLFKWSCASIVAAWATNPTTLFTFTRNFEGLCDGGGSVSTNAGGPRASVVLAVGRRFQWRQFAQRGKPRALRALPAAFSSMTARRNTAGINSSSSKWGVRSTRNVILAAAQPASTPPTVRITLNLTLARALGHRDFSRV